MRLMNRTWTINSNFISTKHLLTHWNAMNCSFFFYFPYFTKWFREKGNKSMCFKIHKQQLNSNWLSERERERDLLNTWSVLMLTASAVECLNSMKHQLCKFNVFISQHLQSFRFFIRWTNEDFTLKNCCVILLI